MSTSVRATTLIDDGMSQRDIRGFVDRGELIHLRYGRYSWDTNLDGERLRHLRLIDATVDELDTQTVLSHHSAAALHGLPLPYGEIVRVTTIRPGRGGGRVRAHHRQQRIAIPVGDTTTVDGLPVTTLARTAVDLAREHPLGYGQAVVDVAETRGVDATQWEDMLARSRRRPGMGKARSAVAHRDGRSESPGESRARVLMRECGIPAPRLQYSVFHPSGRLLGRTDFAWPELRLLGEYDGLVKYGRLLKPGQDPGQVVFAEKRREEAICAQGWWFVRLTAADIRSRAAVSAMWRQAELVSRRLR
ncbi:MAG: hypothetical protein L0G99_14505 [Propionibacteriales bacterium]|nr:hypothetical protein [Propionibacteriales bacterium]